VSEGTVRVKVMDKSEGKGKGKSMGRSKDCFGAKIETRNRNNQNEGKE
jgi:hypothetical protein